VRTGPDLGLHGTHEADVCSQAFGTKYSLRSTVPRSSLEAENTVKVLTSVDIPRLKLCEMPWVRPDSDDVVTTCVQMD